MKPASFAFLPVAFLLTSISLHAETLAPKLEKLSEQEIGEWFKDVGSEQEMPIPIARRGLISNQTTFRARCAQHIARHGTWEDVPYLIDSLSDESVHEGAKYPYAGMASTRYWANVALIAICKVDMGFRWDDPPEKRKEAIGRWEIIWKSRSK